MKPPVVSEEVCTRCGAVIPKGYHACLNEGQVVCEACSVAIFIAPALKTMEEEARNPKPKVQPAVTISPNTPAPLVQQPIRPATSTPHAPPSSEIVPYFPVKIMAGVLLVLAISSIGTGFAAFFRALSMQSELGSTLAVVIGLASLAGSFLVAALWWGLSSLVLAVRDIAIHTSRLQ